MIQLLGKNIYIHAMLYFQTSTTFHIQCIFLFQNISFGFCECNQFIRKYMTHHGDMEGNIQMFIKKIILMNLNFLFAFYFRRKSIHGPVFFFVCVSTELKTTFEHCLLIKFVHFQSEDPTPVLTLSVCLFYKNFGHGLGSKL